MALIDTYRNDFPGLTDAEIVGAIAQHRGLTASNAARYLGVDLPESNTGKNLASGWANYKAGLERFGGELTGSDTLSRWADENTARAELLNATSTSVKDTEDIHGLGDAASWLGYNAAQAVPYVGEFLVPGGLAVKASRGLRTGIRAAEAAGDINKANQLKNALSARVIGAGTVASYPSSTGDIMQNMMEQSGQVDVPSALLMGGPYAALNAVSPEAGIAHALIRGLPTMAKGRIANALATGAAASLVGGAQETGQEVFNQYGRNVVDPNYDPFGDQAQRAYRESFLAGAALSGIPGAIGGGLHKPGLTQEEYDARRLQEEQDRLAEEQARAALEQQAQVEAQQQEFTRANRQAAAKAFPFPAFEQRFKEAEKQASAAKKAATEQALGEYGVALASDPGLDKKQFVEQYLADRGFSAEKRDVRQAYVETLDRIAEYAKDQAQVSELSRANQERIAAIERDEKAARNLPPDTRGPGYSAPSRMWVNSAFDIAAQPSPGRPRVTDIHQEAVNQGVPISGYGLMEARNVGNQVSRGQVAGFTPRGAVLTGDSARPTRMEESVLPGSVGSRQVAKETKKKPSKEQGLRDYAAQKLGADWEQNADLSQLINERKYNAFAKRVNAIEKEQKNALNDSGQALDVARTWDRGNRTGRNVEWQAGAAESNRAFNGVDGSMIPAHGMAKAATLTEALNNLITMLNGGIDPNRTLYYDALTGTPGKTTGATAGGHAYRDGPFIITFREGLNGRQPTSSDVTGVLVNPAHAELAQILQGMYPNLVVRDYNGVADIVSASHAIEKEQKNAVQVQGAGEGVLRSEEPQVGLQKVGEGNAQPQVAAGESVPAKVEAGPRVNNFVLPDTVDVNDEESLREHLVSAIPDANKEAVSAYVEGIRGGSPVSLRALSKAYGVSHQTIKNAVATARAAVKAAAEQAGVSEVYANEVVGFTGPEVEDAKPISEAQAAQEGLSYRKASGPRTVRQESDDSDPTYGYDRAEVSEPESGDVAEAEAQAAEDAQAGEDFGSYDPYDAVHAMRVYDDFVHFARKDGANYPSANELSSEEADAVIAAYTEWDGKRVTWLHNRFEGAINEIESEVLQRGEAFGKDESTGSRQVGGEQAAAESVAEGEPTYTAPAAGRAANVTVKKRRTIQREGVDKQFSTTDSGTRTGTTRQAVEQVIRDITGKDSNWRVHVYQNDAEAVAARILNASEANGKSQAWVMADKKGVLHAYFVLDNIPAGNELGVFLHEVGSHIGIESILKPEQLERLINKILDWSDTGTGVEGQVAKAVMDRLEDAKRLYKRVEGKPMSVAMQQREVVAYFIEEAVKAGVNPTAMQYKNEFHRWVRTIWAAFKVALRRLGVNNIDRLTAQNVVDLAYGAARLELGSHPGADTTPGAIRFSFADTQRQVPEARRVASIVKEVVANKAKNKLLPSMMFAHHLAQYASKLLPHAETYFKERAERLALKNAMEEKVADYARTFYAFDEGVQRALNKFLKVSTESQKWAYKPDWMPNAKVDADMATQFNDLTPEAQEFAKSIFQYGHDALKHREEAINATIIAGLTEMRDAARKGGEAQQAEKYQRQIDETIRSKGKTLQGIEGPYVPLKRFGNWVVALKSPEYVAADEAGDTKKVAELEKDETHYYVDFEESEYAANKRAKELQSKNPGKTVQHFERMFDNEEHQEMPYQILRRLQARVDDVLGSGKSDKAVRNLVNQLYISTLNSTHARKSEIRRRTIAGANEDMMRAFITQGRADANLIASLFTHAKLVSNLESIKQDAKNSGVNRAEASSLLNVILKSHNADMQYRPTPWQNNILKANGLWFLLTSPAYYFQNATQPFLFTAPVLASRYGQRASWNEVFDAYKDVGASIKPASNRAFDVTQVQEKVGGEREMAQELINRRHLDVGLSTELGDYLTPAQTTAGRFVDNAIHKLKMINQHVEFANRLSSALAAYRLKYTEEINGGKTDAEAKAAAIEYADEIVLDTQGDFSAENAPVWMKQGDKRFPMKLAVQFKKFQFIQLSLIGKLANQAFRDSDPTERAIGRKALAYIVANTTMVAGLKGMPILGSAAALAFGMAGDDGEDWETTAKRGIGDKDIARLLLHGIPAAAGIDLSNKLGWQNTLNPFGFVDTGKSSQDAIKNATLSMLLGPTGAQITKLGAAHDLMGKGEYYKGLEKLLPRGLSDAMKGLRSSFEGVTQYNGDVVLSPDEVGVLRGLFQAAGLPTTLVTERDEMNRAVHNITEHFKNEASTIKHKYAKAAKARDTDSMRELRDDWMAMTDSMKRQGLKPPALSTLIKAPQEQAKREKAVRSGVEYTKATAGLVAQLDT